MRRSCWHLGRRKSTPSYQMQQVCQMQFGGMKVCCTGQNVLHWVAYAIALGADSNLILRRVVLSFQPAQF